MATQQEVMKAFMKSLDETEKSGRAALDEAIKASSNFGSYQEVVEKFAKDREAAGDNWHRFLVEKCGIILDNKDTGAISGSDAGGATSKGAEDIIPCEGDASYPSGSSFTVDGVTIYGIPDKDELSEDEQYIVQGLYSWWIRDALALIKESYGLSFTEENTTNARMKLRLYEEDDGTLAYVDPDSEDRKEFETRTLGVNLTNFQDMSSDDRHGTVTLEGQELFLDRTLVHELTHGVMATNVNYFRNLPLPIIEGATAELIQGVDDERYDNIISYVKSMESFEKVCLYLMPELAGGDMELVPYAGGYIFMRYFLKQAADTTFDYDTYQKKVSVDEENFATNYWDKVKMLGSNGADTITNSGERVTIDAKSGANTINNYSDRVTIKAGSGDDTIKNEGSKVKITSGAGDDSIKNDGSNITLKTGAGNDSIINSGSNVKINGDAGNDYISSYFDGLNVSISGGVGNDTLGVYGANASVSGDKGNDVISTGINSTNSTIKGGAGVDSIKNTGENAMIWGDAGNDSIVNGDEGSSAGVGSFTSTASNDTSSVGANSTLYGGKGNDLITNYAAEVFIYGGANNDSIENSGANSAIYGDAGNDGIENSGDNVIINGGAGADEISNGGDSPSIYGGAGDDLIENSGVSSAIYGNAGNDEIINIGEDSAIYGDAGDDFIKNNSDKSSLYGGAGDDNFTNYGDEVFIVGGAGNDSVYNSGSKITLDGGAGDDYIYSEGSVISISSGAGNDSIYSFGDHITVSGDAGNDYIENSGGKHITYQFGADFGNDTVVGFNAGDTIKITSGDYSTLASSNDVIVSVGDSSLLLKDALDLEINFVSETANNLSAIVNNNLTSITLDEIQTLPAENLVQKNTLIAYSDK